MDGTERDASASAFQRTLPRKRLGAGLLLRDGAGRPLLVEPVYKRDWEIPGGVVEADESPRACVIREVGEELGIEVTPGRLLVLDYQHAGPDRTESIMVIFDGGVLGDVAHERMVLAADELASCAFLEPERLDLLASARLARRVRHALTVAASGGLEYLEDGRVPT